VSNRARSKADYTDQNVCNRTRSKIYDVNNLSFQNFFFPLHDKILFLGHGNSQAQDLQLGLFECKVYHNVLLSSKYQDDFDCLLQLIMVDKTEEYKCISWGCYKVVDDCKEKEIMTAQMISVWWNGMIST
jgi:hypothetical protein